MRIIVLVLRNHTESFWVLCCGYLTMIIFQFSNSIAAEPRRLLKGALQFPNIETMPEVGDIISIGLLNKSWFARENALDIARRMQNDLGYLIGITMLWKTRCCITVVSELLEYQDLGPILRMICSIILYFGGLSAMFCGIFTVSDQVKLLTIKIIWEISTETQ